MRIRSCKSEPAATGAAAPTGAEQLVVVAHIAGRPFEEEPFEGERWFAEASSSGVAPMPVATVIQAFKIAAEALTMAAASIAAALWSEAALRFEAVLRSVGAVVRTLPTAAADDAGNTHRAGRTARQFNDLSFQGEVAGRSPAGEINLRQGHETPEEIR